MTLLVAVSFAEYAQPVVDAVSDAHIRNVPVLAITDAITSPLARHSGLVLHRPRCESTPLSTFGGTDRSGTVADHCPGVISRTRNCKRRLRISEDSVSSPVELKLDS